MKKIWTFLLFLLATAYAFAQDLTAIPPLTSPVMDTANMMTDQAREELENHLLKYSYEKGSQIVILTVPNIAPETPFEYAYRVTDQWKLGRAEHNDGILLLLVRDERKTFLAVGRGLEGAIPDVYAKRLLEDVLRPRMAAGQTDEAIFETVGQIEKLIAGEKLPENTHQNNNQDSYLGLLLICFIFAGAFLRLALGDKVGSLATGGVLSVVSLLLGFGILTALFFGLIAAIASFLFGSGAFVSHGGYGGGSWGNGGGFGGGGFGGGGFGGGGGSFGGGGASGGW